METESPYILELRAKFESASDSLREAMEAENEAWITWNNKRKGMDYAESQQLPEYEEWKIAENAVEEAENAFMQAHSDWNFNSSAALTSSDAKSEADKKRLEFRKEVNQTLRSRASSNK